MEAERRFQIHKLEWQRFNAVCFLLFVLAVYSVLRLNGLSGLFANVHLVFWSCGWCFLYSLLLLLPHTKKPFVGVLFLLPVFFVYLWQISSIEIYTVQRRLLSWSELCDLLFTNNLVDLIIDQFLTWSFALATILFWAFYFGLSACLERYRSALSNVIIAFAVLLLFIIGELRYQLWAHHPKHYQQARVSCMPWSSLSVCREENPRAVLSVAREIWYRNDSPLLAAGADPLVGQLHDLYPGRSIVVVLLESHGLVQVDALGAASEHYVACSPYLSQLAQEHIQFTNYFQTGYSTSSAAWSLLSSFPYFYESAHTPHLIKFGAAQSFKDAGYYLEWLKSADTAYAYFDEIAQQLNMPAGMTDEENSEQKNKDAALWSAWGMPDEQLFDCAYKRIEQRINDGSGPFVQFVLTVSNHNPFYLPKEVGGKALTRDYRGGMRYADYCLQQFVERLKALPAEQRPVIFITADTGFRSGHYFIADEDELPVELLESMRLPAVLVLPDGRKELNASFNEMFDHQDVLPLLAYLVGVSTPFDERVQSYKRTHVLMDDYNGPALLNKHHYLFANTSFMDINDYWSLQLGDTRSQACTDLKTMYQYFDQMRQRLWQHGGLDAASRGENKQVIGSFEMVYPAH